MSQNHGASPNWQSYHSPAEVYDQVALGGEPHVAVLAPEGLRVMPPVRRQLGGRHEHLVAILALVGNLHVNDRLSKVMI